MMSEHWELVKTLFLEAVSLGPEDQEAFLRHLNEEDHAISDMVKGLLAQSAESAPDIRNPCWVQNRAPSPAHAFESGRILLDRFEIGSFLGAGGIGEVYQAYDRQQEVFVALKTLRPALAWDQKAVLQLRNELNTARSITHRNVCRLHDFHWTSSAELPPFFTMELVEGKTLAEHLRTEGPLSAGVARGLVDQMIEALDAAHRRSIVHRDFKSANVMLTEGGRRVVILDFGLARELAHGLEIEASLAENGFGGTPAYMSPEQLRGERATFASDIHALGVVMFEMVTARRPFEGSSVLEIASRRLHEEAPSPRQFVRGLDRVWEHTILRCLARDPALRPQFVHDVRMLLNTPQATLRRRAFVVSMATAPLAVGGIATALFISGRAPVRFDVFDIENQTGLDKMNFICTGTTSELLRTVGQIRSLKVVPFMLRERICLMFARKDLRSTEDCNWSAVSKN